MIFIYRRDKGTVCFFCKRQGDGSLKYKIAVPPPVSTKDKNEDSLGLPSVICTTVQTDVKTVDTDFKV